MMLKIKQIGMLLVTMSAMLVLFAGCGDKDDGGDKESLATLVAETVSSSTTTNKISTQGPSGITFRGDDRLAGRGCGVVFVRFE